MRCDARLSQSARRPDGTLFVDDRPVGCVVLDPAPDAIVSGVRDVRAQLSGDEAAHAAPTATPAQTLSSATASSTRLKDGIPMRSSGGKYVPP